MYIDERFLRVQLFGVFEVALSPLGMVLLQADEASDGVSLGNRGKADGLCRVFEGIGQIAEVAEGLTAEKVGAGSRGSASMALSRRGTSLAGSRHSPLSVQYFCASSI